MLGLLKYYLKQALRRASDSYGSRIAKPLQPSRWGLTADAQRGLCLGGISLHELMGRHGSPLLVLDVAALKRNARQCLGAADRGVEVFYSYKTNPVAYSLSTLHAEGVGAEVISAYELWLALRLGVPPERIVYNGPVKSEASVRTAIERGIGLITANHDEEIDVLARLASEAGRRPRTGIRVSLAQGWSGQFGVPMGEAAMQAFARARSLQSLDLCALHAHRGGMIHTEAELVAMIDQVLAFSDALAARFGINLEILDFGGSLGSPSVGHIANLDYRLNRALLRDVPPPDIDAALGLERYVAILAQKVGEHFARVGRARPRVFVEPGRSLTSNTQFLLLKVHALKGASDRTYAIMDGGINIAEPVRSEYHQLFPVNRINEPASRVYTVVGPICTPADTLYPAVRLPELKAGDSLCIMDAGAYFVPFATSFSYPQPAIVAIEGDREMLVRRAEQFDDMAMRDLPLN